MTNKQPSEGGVVKFTIILTLLALILTSARSSSQNLYDGPESVAFDTVQNRYLVSNVRDGRMIQVDSEGNQSFWGTPVTSYRGNIIVGNTLYATTGTVLIGMDLETAQFNFSFQVGEATSLDGMAADTSGYLYVVDTQIRLIYKIKLSDGSHTTLVTSGLYPSPQDIVFDAEHNRLLVCSYTVAAPVIGVDVVSGEITTVIGSTIGFHDGITIDPDGNVYLACSQPNKVIKYERGFGSPPETLVSGIRQPAGLDFNWRDSILAVPSFGGDSVMFIDCNDSDNDGVINHFDNCPEVANTDQINSDTDSFGDGCDNCPNESNQDQTDSDSNGIGDVCEGCCGAFTEGMAGNADCSEDGKRNLADITRLIDRVYISKSELCCEENGNTDADTEDRINLSDITRLIDHVYISKNETGTCL